MANTKENKDFIDFLDLRILDEAIDYIQNRYSPEQIFDVSDLENWAMQNNFIKKEN